MTATTVRSATPVTDTSNLFARLLDRSDLTSYGTKHLDRVAEIGAKVRRSEILTGREVVEGANLISAVVAFEVTDAPRVQALIRALDLIGGLDPESSAANAYAARSIVGQVAAAAAKGYSLPYAGEIDRHVAEIRAHLLRAYVLEVGAADPTVIGALYVAAEIRRDDHGTPWGTRYAIAEQTVPVRLAAERTERQASVSWQTDAVEIDRETGAQLGGVDVVRSVVKVDRPTTLGTSVDAGSFAGAIATGKLEGRFVLHPEARIVATPYTHAPERLAFRLER